MKKIIATLVLATLFLAGCSTTPRRPAPAPEDGHFIETKGERPGIGTTWAEQRESWVEKASFVRGWTERPGGTGMLYYNDSEGVDAMLDYLGGDSKHRTGLYPTANSLVSIGLRDKDGQWYSGHELKGKRFVVGITGERYEIVLKNETEQRIEVVVTVDGLDVLDGKSGSYKKRGYIVEPESELTIDGFRTSDSSVAAFRFGSVPESYANLRKRGAANVGVIGVAVFQERIGAAPREGQEAFRRVTERSNPTNRTYATPPEA
jgi:hypothetical protein